MSSLDDLLNNPERLESLESYEIVDSEHEERFDEIARLAAEICDVPMSLVSLVLDDRQWFKCNIGLETRETSIDVSFCKFALERDDDIFEVCDATLDSRFENNELVVGELGIRFYAGAPLRSRDGTLLGTLCVLDTQPRQLSTYQRNALKTLSKQVMAQLELRRQLKRALEAEQTALGLAERERSALQRLKRSEERFRQIGRASSDLIWDYDLATGHVWRGSKSIETRALSREGMAPDFEGWMEGIHPEDRQRIVDSFRHATTTGAEQWSEAYRMQNADGEVFDVVSRGVFIRDDNGTVIRAVGGTSDVTEKKQAERRLHTQAAVIEQALEAILIQDLEGNLTFFNRSAAEYYGLDHDSIGQHAAELLGFGTDQFESALKSTLGNGGWNGEVTNSDSQTTVFESRWALILGNERVDDSILLINYDITERRKLEQDFLRAQRTETLGRLAGGIAHDLNNVLSPILVTASMLRELVEDQVLQADLEVIEHSARRGAAMISRLLTFARGKDGQRMQIDAREELESVVELLRETLPKDIELKLEGPRELWVTADPTQLDQVVTNLIINARDSMPEGGTITLRVRQEIGDFSEESLDAIDFVVIEVEDTGVGIAEGDLPAIFDPYFSTKPLGQGTGLGLSTSMGIVTSHGGLIRVESEEGTGTRFSVYLPRVEEGLDLESSTVAEIDPDFAPTEGSRVLIIDDEPAILSSASRVLERAGFRVTTAQGGEAGIRSFDPQTFDVVISDVMMPQVSGHTAVSAIRSISPDVPILVWSGRASLQTLDELRDLGVNEFLSKPFAAKELVATVRRLHRVNRGKGGDQAP